MRSLILGVLLTVVVASLAGAGPVEDAAKAEALFADGNRLREAGNLSEACTKFEEALHYNRNAVGTILNVALCDQQVGKIASAAKLFAEARDRAREQNLGEHRKAAEDHLAQIVDDVPHLAIAFVEPPSADTKLLIDGEVIEIASAGDVAIDPGTRTIVVTAPNRVPFETKLTIAVKEHKALSIPKLALPVTVNGGRTLGKVVTVAGAGLAVTGIVLGLVARSEYNSLFTQIDPTTATPTMAAVTYCQDQATPKCSPRGQAKASTAGTTGTAGTIVGLGGVVAIGIGGYLWLFAPHDAEKLAFVPSVNGDQIGLAAVGRF